MANKKAQSPKPKALMLGVSLRPDRIQWVRQTADRRGISISQVVRDLIDEARKQNERESMTA